MTLDKGQLRLSSIGARARAIEEQIRWMSDTSGAVAAHV
jgi:hypothetical protein